MAAAVGNNWLRISTEIKPWKEAPFNDYQKVIGHGIDLSSVNKLSGHRFDTLKPHLSLKLDHFVHLSVFGNGKLYTVSKVNGANIINSVDLVTLKKETLLTLPQDTIRAITTDGENLYLVDNKGLLRVLDIRTNHITEVQITSDRSMILTMVIKNNYLYAGGMNGNIIVHDLLTSERTTLKHSDNKWITRSLSLMIGFMLVQGEEILMFSGRMF